MSEFINLFNFWGYFFDFLHEVRVERLFLRVERLLRIEAFFPEILRLIDPELALKPDRENDFVFVRIFGGIRLLVGNLWVSEWGDFASKFTNFGFVQMILVEIEFIEINEELWSHKDPEIVFLIHNEKHFFITLRLIHKNELEDGMIIDLLFFVKDLVWLWWGDGVINLFIGIDILQFNDVRKNHLMSSINFPLYLIINTLERFIYFNLKDSLNFIIHWFKLSWVDSFAFSFYFNFLILTSKSPYSQFHSCPNSKDHQAKLKMETVSAQNYSEPISRILTSKNSGIWLNIRKMPTISAENSPFKFSKPSQTNLHHKSFLPSICPIKP